MGTDPRRLHQGKRCSAPSRASVAGWFHCDPPSNAHGPPRLCQVAAITVDDGTAWSTDDAALLKAVDELHADAHIGDATWATLSERWTTEQLIELCMVVGQYHLVAFTLNSLGVQREAGVEGLPAR